MGRVEDRRLAALEREAEARVFQAAMQMNTDDDTRVLGAYAERALEAIDAGVSLPAPTPEERAAFDRFADLCERARQQGWGRMDAL